MQMVVEREPSRHEALSAFLMIRCPVDTHARLKELARRENASCALLVRKLIDDALERSKSGPLLRVS